MNNVTAALSGMEVFKEKLIDLCTLAGGKIIIALLIYIIGKAIIKKLLKLIDKTKAVKNLDATAHNYVLTCIKAVLYIVLVISIIAELGVPMASVIAVLASCGVAVGLALQGALGNLAGGIMLLIFRPFNVGDYIIAGGEEGVVKKISLIYTIINTVDNKMVSIPNGSLMNANIANASAEKLRRVDLTFNVAGSVPYDKVQSTVLKVIGASEKALADPAPQVEPVCGIPGGLQYTVRVWTESPNYWDVYFEMMREIPSAFGEAGISGPSTPVTVNNAK